MTSHDRLAPLAFCCLLGVLFLGVARADAAEPDARYLAVFVDGSRVEGKVIRGWGKNADSPKLDNTALADPNRPLRWLCDLSLPVFRARSRPSGMVELAGGDWLPGLVVGLEEPSLDLAAGLPQHLLVEPAVSVDAPSTTPRPHVRVLPSMVRRIVWSGNAHRLLPPGTLLYRNGSRVAFRSLRWRRDAITLLLDEGVRQVTLGEVAEIHFPSRDIWADYYEELTALSPDCSERLVRLETADGLTVTGSARRFQTAGGSADDCKQWYHMVQPAWSLDPLWIHFPSIRTRLSFAPHEVPLSRLHPNRVVQRSMLGKGWLWQVDRNVQGGPLQSGGRVFGWGYGVHAANEMSFKLPECVSGFRSLVGLDELVGEGGCARALVFANGATGNPLYRSKDLIGSKETVDTGVVSLGGPKAGQNLLVLVADAVAEGHPPTADPLDIRDALDWIEPMLLLDPAKLKPKVLEALPRAVPAWNGWAVSVDGAPAPQLEDRWDESDPKTPRYVTEVATGGRALSLSARRRVSADGDWLMLQLKQWAKDAKLGQIEVRVDDRPIAQETAPPYGVELPLLVPLEAFRDKEVTIQVVYTPGDDKDRLEWQAAALVARPEVTGWVTLPPTLIRGLGNATFTPQDDGSILVGGEPPPNDVYTVEAKTDLAGITAVRLEAMLDESLPKRGPGITADGKFVLSRFSLGLLPKDGKVPEGQYVRVDLPQPPLSLAEVQVISGGKNVAPDGTATQSSTGHNAPAERANDGITDGDFGKNSVTHTADTVPHNTQPPWWEVDLGGVKPIENIAIWNRKTVPERLANFRVSVLDADRKPVWVETVAKPPQPMVELKPVAVVPVAVRSAVADFSQEKWPVDGALHGTNPAEHGWAIGTQEGRPHWAVFLLEKPLDAGQTVLVVEMAFLYPAAKHTLGRFRLSITDDEPSIGPDRLGKVVPLLP